MALELDSSTQVSVKTRKVEEAGRSASDGHGLPRLRAPSPRSNALRSNSFDESQDTPRVSGGLPSRGLKFATRLIVSWMQHHETLASSTYSLTWAFKLVHLSINNQFILPQRLGVSPGLFVMG